MLDFCTPLALADSADRSIVTEGGEAEVPGVQTKEQLVILTVSEVSLALPEAI